MRSLRKNNVSISGSGSKTLVFVHGYGCDQSMWRFVAPQFELSHRVVLYDLTGMGQSDLSEYDFKAYRTLQRHADDLTAILEDLEVSDGVLIGHSVGATIACLAALKCPERISALALVAPSPSFMNDAAYTGGFDREALEGLVNLMDENFLGWTSRVTPTIAGEDRAGETAAELTQSFCRTDPAIAKHFGRITFLADHRADMKRVEAPAAIIQCTDDALAPVDVGVWLSENMKRGTLKFIEATGHCPHMTEPAKTTEAIREFLAVTD